jgi:hypothetical protein
VVLVYDPRGLPGVTTTRPEVAGVLQSSTSLKLQICPDVTQSQSGACSDFSEPTLVLM